VTVLTALAFVLLCFGTYLLSRQRYVWDAALLVGVSLALLGWAMSRSRGRRAALLAEIRSLLPRAIPGWLRALSLGLSAWVAVTARARPDSAGFAPLLAAWVLAVVLFVAATWWRPWRLQFDLSAHDRREILWLGLLLLCAAAVRGIALGRIPYNLGGDEGTQLAYGLVWVRDPMGNPFATGWYSVPTLSFLAYGLVMRLFGATIAGGRLLSVAAGTLTVATTYLLGRALSGKWVGRLAAGIMAFSAYHIHFSRLASNQIADPLIGTLALWLIVRALWAGGRQAEGRRGAQIVDGEELFCGLPFDAMRSLGLAGVVAGAGWYAYFGARWVTILIGGIFVLQSLLAPQFLRRYWRGMLLFALGWLVVVLPLLGWYTTRPSALSERYQAVSVFASGWLRREVEVTGRGPISLMAQQLWRSATAFHLTHDPTFWYYPERPLVDFITGGLLLVGLLDAVCRLRWPSRWLTLLWFGSTLVMAWVVTENPPSSQRGLLLAPAVAVLASWGAVWLAQRLGGGGRALRWVAGGLIALLAVLNCTFYFGYYTPKRTYGNPTAEIATAFARYTLAHPEPVCGSPAPSGACTGRIYFFGPPRLYWEFGTLRFLLRTFPGRDVAEGMLPQGVTGSARFAFVPERAHELAAVSSHYPGGELHELRNPAGNLLMVIYDWVGPVS
jgi:4-amino-4-deoxy-L-arabinose transferase-like glycosyltransferase